MPTKALMTGQTYQPATLAGTGAVTGEILAVPITQGKSERFVSVQINFGADPGAFVYNLMGSLDGVNFVLLNTALVSGTTSPILAKVPANVNFVRLDQVSKANSVVATAQLMLE